MRNTSCYPVILMVVQRARNIDDTTVAHRVPRLRESVQQELRQ